MHIDKLQVMAACGGHAIHGSQFTVARCFHVFDLSLLPRIPRLE